MTPWFSRTSFPTASSIRRTVYLPAQAPNAPGASEEEMYEGLGIVHTLKQNPMLYQALVTATAHPKDPRVLNALQALAAQAR